MKNKEMIAEKVVVEKSRIRFTANKKKEFIDELRQSVKQYFEKKNFSKFGNKKMVLKTITMFSLYIIPYLLMYTEFINIIPLLFMCWVLMGLGMAGVGLSVMHDASHKSYSGNMKINKLLSKSMYLLGGFPVIWQYQHNTLHHGYTNIDGLDEDIDPGSVLRFSPHKPLYKFHRYQYIYFWLFYGIMTLSWVSSKEFIQLFKYKKTHVKLSRKTYGVLFIELIFSKLLYHTIFLILPLIILPFAWYWIVLAFLTMHIVCGLLLAIIFSSAHIVPSSEYPLPDENGSMENNWAIHQLLTTSNFSPRSKLLTWLIGGLNYQIEHHLFPNICHVHYRDLSKLVKEKALKYHLPYHVQPSFIRAVGSHVKMLKLLGR